ncbi:MAG: branched-chain amino acid ABC transporter permease [Mesorhizobium sp.]|uniref:branched-chain amino acid ABC transporter permease n=1 Tax=Mesorhizobium sp. TaxID=1871066 RepID=UPI000FE94990|nr:branched-chain amino acid ABC transporter permease [Mesorhizobium sp.]RWG57340.1 MAG: branched-chain amino acid ABC transporter permease [Mesorhizobium sp.]RWH25674.1 MAG: branched-chain amino acid ABC transporter permease [Mesorhizobium sp.]RWH35373.1 MAG: branched-chain amino acid ABC transporter permease [Mesorhizobium sp.]RWH44096.1 MAG: branched-chain amino acid ABC transporter permease [Mesorhizobium sp.]TIM69782.1 MAG: branched-chain amino acid ABC transporter permease [Mesorhizobium
MSNDIRRTVAATAGFVLVAALLPATLSGFQLQQVGIAISYAVAILGLNLLMGFAGQICLAQGTLFGIGAYVTAILNATYGVHPLATLPAAAVFTALAGLVVGLPALRLQGLQLAIITFGVAAAFPQLLLKLGSWTGGVSGLAIDSLEPPAFLADYSELWLYLVSLGCACVAAFIVYLVLLGDVGRALQAQRDSPQIAEALGVNLTKTKLWAFAISSALAGLGGGVFAILNGFISPQSFLAPLSITIVIGSIVGGSTSIVGAFIGGLFITFVPTWTSSINLALGNVIYALALIGIMLLARGGVAGLLERLAAALTARSNANGKAGSISQLGRKL